MTWIIDDSGRHWVEPVERKKRRSPQALRFADVKVGDQVMTGAPPAIYFLVTDLWFDPVAGQRDPVAGQMAAIQQIGPSGEVRGSKRAHTIRGLASQGFHPADMDYIQHCQARHIAIEQGVVVGIGAGRRAAKAKRGGG